MSDIWNGSRGSRKDVPPADRRLNSRSSEWSHSFFGNYSGGAFCMASFGVHAQLGFASRGIVSDMYPSTVLADTLVFEPPCCEELFALEAWSPAKEKGRSISVRSPSVILKERSQVLSLHWDDGCGRGFMLVVFPEIARGELDFRPFDLPLLWRKPELSSHGKAS